MTASHSQLESTRTEATDKACVTPLVSGQAKAISVELSLAGYADRRKEITAYRFRASISSSSRASLDIARPVKYGSKIRGGHPDPIRKNRK